MTYYIGIHFDKTSKEIPNNLYNKACFSSFFSGHPKECVTLVFLIEKKHKNIVINLLKNFSNLNPELSETEYHSSSYSSWGTQEPVTKTSKNINLFVTFKPNKKYSLLGKLLAISILGMLLRLLSLKENYGSTDVINNHIKKYGSSKALKAFCSASNYKYARHYGHGIALSDLNPSDILFINDIKMTNILAKRMKIDYGVVYQSRVIMDYRELSSKK